MKLFQTFSEGLNGVFCSYTELFGVLLFVDQKQGP